MTQSLPSESQPTSQISKQNGRAPLPPAGPERVAAIAAAFNENRSGMTMLLARKLAIPEGEVIAALPDGLSTRLRGQDWEPLIRAFEPLGMVHVIASNGAVTLECFGQFGNFSVWGEFFNVQTKSLDMHIRYNELDSIFAVRKPGHLDAREALSFQFFDRRGASAFKVFLTFGGAEPSPERLRQFTELRERFAAPEKEK